MLFLLRRLNTLQLHLTVLLWAGSNYVHLIIAECPSEQWMNNTVTNKCYFVTAREHPYSDCVSSCSPGRPVCVMSEKENDEVYRFFKQSDSPQRGYFLGIDDRRTEGFWEWHDECFSDHLQFHDGEPDNCQQNEDCAVAIGEDYTSDISYLDGSWIDVRCSEEFLCMCEYTGAAVSDGEHHRLRISNDACASDNVGNTLMVSLLVSLGCCCIFVCTGAAVRAQAQKRRRRERRVAAAPAPRSTFAPNTVTALPRARGSRITTAPVYRVGINQSSTATTSQFIFQRILAGAAGGLAGSRYLLRFSAADDDSEDAGPACAATTTTASLATATASPVGVAATSDDHPPLVTPRLPQDCDEPTAAQVSFAGADRSSLSSASSGVLVSATLLSVGNAPTVATELQPQRVGSPDSAVVSAVPIDL